VDFRDAVQSDLDLGPLLRDEAIQHRLDGVDARRQAGETEAAVGVREVGSRAHQVGRVDGYRDAGKRCAVGVHDLSGQPARELCGRRGGQESKRQSGAWTEDRASAQAGAVLSVRGLKM